MTEIPVQFPPLALDPATRSTMMQAVADCLPYLPNASAAERTALRDAAFALVGQLCPTDPVEAMLTAEAVAAHYAGMHAFRCAATRPDLPYDLQLRFQASGRSLARLSSAKRRELLRHQAARASAAQAAQAQAAAPSAPARPAAPAPRADAVAAGRRAASAAPAAAPRRRDADPLQAMINQLVAKAVDDCEDDDLADTTEAEAAQLIAASRALLAETNPPAGEMAARLQAELDARKAAATKLAA